MPAIRTVFSRSAFAASLLAGSILTSPAFAQEKGEVELSADLLTYDADTGEARALGRVKLVHEGMVLEAGEIRYSEKTGNASAHGAVTLTMKDGNRIVAPQIELTDNLKRAFVEDIRLLLADGAQVAAKSAMHDETTGRTELDLAVFSPCKVCEGDSRPPLWQIKAVEVVHDAGKKRLTYRDARLEVLGVPVLWTPYFSHPDPEQERASGLLPPDLKTTKELGVVAAFPYYQVFTPSIDATLTPILTSKEGAILAAEYRQHVGIGQFEISGSATPANDFDENGVDTGENTVRGHFSSEGRFQHDSNWRSTYQVNWASDDTYLRRYDFSKVDTLISDYSFEGFFGRSYVAASAMAFQGLRQEDISGKTGFVLPLLQAEYVTDAVPIGGTVSLKANALMLQRTDGLDTNRLSISGNWRRRWIADSGFVFDADALIRGDAYYITDASEPDDPDFGGDGGTTFRGLSRITGSATYPLVRYGAHGTHVLEPILEVTLSPARGSPLDLVNEDSRAFELNELNIFSAERASGYDLWEEGSRVTAGMRWRYESSDWLSHVLVGQAYRLTGDGTEFDEGTGLEGDVSDIVVRTLVSYKDWLDIQHAFRMDESSLALRRNEVSLRVGGTKSAITVGYLNLDRGLAQFELDDREDREELRATAHYGITDEWRLYGSIIQNLTNGWDGVEYDIGLGYRDECVEFSTTLRKTYTRDRDIDPGTSILFRLKLKNLG
ncbi:LPS-assembly protein LptD [Gimibacter soli]|uniref:LPS-assembly protein LptD n=1 Tax=Gimibacter soli TaxID=3024400 RepID=A0AAF0BFR9_9PROT|nr:LPS assembly protein LptD [Gimibacter soli]WCL52798.1 LPS assembly protein LptD [Gimibacter soli]